MTQKRVLVIDDEPAILRILEIKLRVSGYEVVTASNGEQGLELAESTRPDVVLLDIILPGIDGFKVLKELRSRSGDPPVVAFSAMSECARKALSLGAADFLVKPFDVDDLVRRTEKAMTSS